ncbi:MAG: hypothetical protein IT462_07050 [Planctomycetes bacterium]|nr:hypothetical protein [Planctomycetota bacterium]
MTTKLKLFLVSLRRLSSRVRAKLARKLAALSRSATKLLAGGLPGKLSYRLCQVAIAMAMAAGIAASTGVVKADPLASRFSGSDDSRPAIAKDADGDAIVVWTGDGTYHDGSGSGVYARRYASSGANLPESYEFRVNTYVTAAQQRPDVAMDADGDFVIVWESFGQDGNNYGIFAQRFNAAGAPLGGEFQVNTYETNYQSNAKVAMDADGDFVVVWQSLGQVSDWDVFGQRFAADGTPVGNEFQINTETALDQSQPSVAMDAVGNFVVVWHSFGQDSNGFGVFGQRFDNTGASVGAEFQVNTTEDEDQHQPNIGMDVDGDFVVVWASYVSNAYYSSASAVYGQRYSAAGNPVGAEMLISSLSSLDYAFEPSVAMDADGDFAVAWTFDSGPSYISVRGFNADGTQDFAVYSQASSLFFAGTPDIAVDADGDYQVVWAEYNYYSADGTNNIGIGSGGLGNTGTASPIVAGVFLKYDHHHVTAGETLAQHFQHLIVSFSEAMTSTNVENTGNWTLTHNGAPVGIDTVNYRLNEDDDRYEAELFFGAVPLGDGNYVLTLDAGVEDSAGNGLDGDFNGVADGDFSISFSVRTPWARGSSNLVNTEETDDQDMSAIAKDADGDYVIVWQSDNQDYYDSGMFAYDTLGIYAQRYSASGAKVGPEILVNETISHNQTNPDVAMDADGNFVVVWEGYGNAGYDSNDVWARQFTAAGLPVAGEILVNGSANGNQQNPSVSVDQDGDFIVTWDGYCSYGVSDTTGIACRLFRADGTPRRSEFLVNTTLVAVQSDPDVAMDADGDFVIVWSGYNSSADSSNGFAIFKRDFDNDGNPINNSDSRVALDYYVYGEFQFAPSVSMDADGDYVVAWDNYFYSWSNISSWHTVRDVRARMFHANGYAAGDDFVVQRLPNVNNITIGISTAMDEDGDFVVAWNQYQYDYYSSSTVRSDVMVRRFNANAVAQGAPVQVTTPTSGWHWEPAVAMDADGDFNLSFTNEDSNLYGVFTHMFEGNTAPTTSGIPDQVVDEDDDPLVVNLAPFFADAEDADAELAYTIVANTNPAVVAAGISGTSIGLAFPADANGTADITVRVTDTGGLWVEDTFTVTVNPVDEPLPPDTGGDDDDSGCVAASTGAAPWGLLAVLFAAFGSFKRLVRRKD